MVENRLLGRIHDVGRRRHDDELRNVLVAREPVLHRGYRNVDRVVRALYRSASGSLRLGDADDSEIDVSHLDVLSEGVRGSEKVGGGRRSENGDFRTGIHVVGGDEHAVLRLDVLDFGIVRADAVDGSVGVDVSDDDLFGGRGDRRNRRDS